MMNPPLLETHKTPSTQASCNCRALITRKAMKGPVTLLLPLKLVSSMSMLFLPCVLNDNLCWIIHKSLQDFYRFDDVLQHC